MSITVTNTTPADAVSGHYLNHDIFVEFDTEIESSFLSSDFFKLYRTNATKSEYYEFLDVTVTKDSLVVQIHPTEQFSPLSYYMLIIVGGTNGIQSLTGDTLDENSIISFQTAETIAPTDNPPEIVPDVDIHIDGDSSNNANEPSTSLFATQGLEAPISLVTSFPADKSVGVHDFTRLILLYNDTIDPAITIPLTTINGRWNDLPFDMDPFGDRSIPITDVSISGRQLIFETDEYTETTNREYIFNTAPGIVRGENKQGYDNRTHEIRFLGPLNPVYASVEQILKRITGWDVDLDAAITEYDIWKLILEASLWVRDVYETTMNSDNLIQVNRLTICMVLRELFIRGMLFIGGVKSRTLLAVRVDYETHDWDNIIQELEKCIRESLPEDSPMGGAGIIFTGIKSGRALNDLRGDPSKRYGVYR